MKRLPPMLSTKARHGRRRRKPAPGQAPLGLARPSVSIDQGVEHALDSARRRARVPRAKELQTCEQFSFDLRPARYRSRGTKRYCKYPFQMVADARAMRANGYFYKEIAAALEKTHGKRVPWITVRDWTNFYHRVLP